ncbi:carboxypeptidase-like regulatory domain-containing protein [Lacibacter sediminis]|uniref:Carboxypeptidase-like regulatory domain-containing protein n=1 Tax=Lacibacter sediminis TaxID=2760713 RepID=A0A7G5XBY1_9BACT|nr:carboxypeptidase-like regulatory domain-containing protein [Lacibacter sediminis]QNA42984.1 carboxypeptidase-like regulatory domain-containing protein [Lacibacter sediminis]
MSEKLYLSIADPCHEDWNKMTPVEQGRFCSSCQKNVVDFTMQTDEEIISFFNNYNGSACGRFTDDQLDRPIQKIELKPASSFLKYAAGLLLPAFLFATKAKGQFKEQVPKQANKTVCLPSSETAKEQVIVIGGYSTSRQQKILFISGSVIDEITKEPLAGVSIMIKGTNQGVVTNEKGLYSIYLPSKKSELQFSSIGYEMKEIKASELKRANEAIVKMKAATVDMLGVIVVGYQTRRMGGMTGAVSIITRSRVSILDTLLPAKVKVYPNPVAATGTINISFPDVKPGQYQIRLLNATGQLFYSFQKQISGRGETEQIHLSSNMTAGMYVLQVLDEQKKLVQTTKLSVQ